TQLVVKVQTRLSVQQLNAIEINSYAFELAQVSVQIGYLQWRRDNGFDNEREPVLQNLENFENEDALLVPHFRGKAKSLKEAQASEHAGDNALKFYTERKWPESDVIVGNPPLLGGNFLRRESQNTSAHQRKWRRLFRRERPPMDSRWRERSCLNDRLRRRLGKISNARWQGRSGNQFQSDWRQRRHHNRHPPRCEHRHRIH